MSATLARLQKVEKFYAKGSQKVHVLSDLDLEIPAGDFLALMGPSGSGKTTLLNLLGGLDRPTGGSVEVGGHRIDQLSNSALAKWRGRHVGFVFQFYNLMPVLTAERNVELPLLLTNLSRSQRRERARIALSVVGLADRATHYPSELSGGQQQRVAIARAIVSDPDLLLCDEPTGDLDRNTANEIMELLKELNRAHGKTVIMVTHDPHAAEFASHVIDLEKADLTNYHIGAAA